MYVSYRTRMSLQYSVHQTTVTVAVTWQRSWRLGRICLRISSSLIQHQGRLSQTPPARLQTTFCNPHDSYLLVTLFIICTLLFYRAVI
ncbi:serine/threonine-protein phosphatase PP2A-1 catalytic subunit [Iris pallida]|uniref:Serine/threonine-protein phosphatase PP2A-1 catalytic subunit n=1 Tax=Iris pallida TaxID=29817 RepID=A0AAX6DQM9_IRIPA|nr:serine/threonine-protein phosphatase PP2A-1 catalytic subunit [Iris pallida]KAJ6813182.1 serine/threonine-protein phosphatase PP2A-1 catalytic subunit [Iris pallida]